MSRQENVPAGELPVTRRQMIGLLSGTLAVVASGQLFDASGVDTDLPTSTASGPFGDGFPGSIERRYRGTATTELPPTPLAPGSERPPVRHDVLVTVGPQSAPGGAEPATRNPFHLSIATADRDGPVPTGPGAVASTAVVLDPESGRRTVIDHWEIQAGADGVFSGVLRTEDRTTNALTSRRELVPGRSETTLLVTEALAGGTTLRGTVTEDEMEIRMVGNTVNRFADDALDRTRPFVTVVRASREQ
ncbi:hypothetical protein HUG10_19340 (plasmid) [Halorarum halophilum]|uniref:Uncharacterized protein n=1 Tax=Halorarum halophilum TaxID=2743090 RepID=A0A7D5KW18_9EURY|nr:hypothetical protein [Halobaculum halophilum]QLG29760.1 hypothetical protein HUG10_19340 [Halobaculum halophilum]